MSVRLLHRPKIWAYRLALDLVVPCPARAAAGRYIKADPANLVDFMLGSWTGVKEAFRARFEPSTSRS